VSVRTLGMAAVLLCIAGCGGGGNSGSPTSPGVTQPGGGSPIVMKVTGAAAFSFTFQGQTITSSGTYTFNNMQIGTYTVSGTFANRLSFNMGTPNPSGSQGQYDGQVQHAMTNISGPTTGQTDCGPAFADPSPSGTAGGNIAFSFQFTIAPKNSFSQSSPPCGAPS